VSPSKEEKDTTIGLATSADLAALENTLAQLQGRVGSLEDDVIDLQDSMAELSADLATEVTDRQAADTALQAALDSETAARIAGDLSCANQGAIKAVAPAFQVDASCPAILVADPANGSTVSFTSQGQDQIFTITNSGAATAGTISGVFYTNGDSTGWGTVSSTCTGQALAPGGSCSVTVRKSFGNGITPGTRVDLLIGGTNLRWTLVYNP
jgi:hypothetical protein